MESWSNGVMEWWVRTMSRVLLAGFAAVVLLVSIFGIASAQQLDTLNVSYASVTGSRIPTMTFCRS